MTQGPAPVRGMLVIDKPAGLTSHDLVLAVRHRLRARAGHTGTLDPQATGVLLVCVGEATRLTRFLQHDDKVYECVVRFGWATDTYDAEGEPLAPPVAVPALDAGTVEAALARFRGTFEQVPPAYSAKKVHGVPSYRRVRRGERVQHAPVKVTIHALELLALEPESLRLRVHCGPGTYVRTLAHELGEALGCPAHLAALRRLRVGSFDLAGAIDGAALREMARAELLEHLLPPEQMLPEWPLLLLRESGVAVLRHGGVIEPRHVAERLPGRGGATVQGSGGARWVRLCAPDGRMVAAAEALPGGMLQPRVVFGGAGRPGTRE